MNISLLRNNDFVSFIFGKIPEYLYLEDPSDAALNKSLFTTRSDLQKLVPERQYFETGGRQDVGTQHKVD